MTRSRRRPNNPCTKCGGTFFGTTYTDTVPSKRLWECENCGTTQPCSARRRLSNRHKTLELYKKLQTAWEPTNEALKALCAAGLPNGALLVHCSTFNHHMNRLLDIAKPTNFEVRYHSKGAGEDLEKAKAFVAVKQEERGIS